ncbi:hypothetical protein [Pseudomonas helleri]|uniref:hypothetical protein n=1 Tax=Pseudomonas helleri TaxID=1608996 RepID=UPI003F979149
MLFQEVLFSWRIFSRLASCGQIRVICPWVWLLGQFWRAKKNRLIRGGFPQAQLVAGLLSSQGASTFSEFTPDSCCLQTEADQL